MKRPRLEPIFDDLPDRISGLGRLATNLWWSWSPSVSALFETIDPEAWARHGNPVRLLLELDRSRLDELGTHGPFLLRLDRAEEALDAYLRESGTWFDRTHPGRSGDLIAYLSAEFGLHESLPIYCGGLGVLAGDHMKSASDLGVPLIGVGLLYRHGYFDQRIDGKGRQTEIFPDHDPGFMPIRRVRDEEGGALVITLPVSGRKVETAIWAVEVGRNWVYLLSSDVEGAPKEDRDICSQLYGTERANRLEQEQILGLGAIHLTHRLGLRPAVWHMNEGHSVLQALARLRRRVSIEDHDYEAAKRIIASRSIFTTHTPVAAGNEAFDVELVEEQLGAYCESSGIDLERFIDLGRQPKQGGENGTEELSLTVLALRLSSAANGVSRMHAQVSRDMWRHVFPVESGDDVPIGSVTNGVHTQTWMAPEMMALLDEHLGADWIARLTEPEWWNAAREIPGEALWAVHQILKRRLLRFVAERENARRARESVSFAPALDPSVLTIGFARRFAPYKRANLLAGDPDRLRRILCHPERPVQLLFAGKAYPTDTEGKALVAEIGRLASDPDLAGRIVLIEDYDMNVGRHLVQGVDVWLNNPRRPQEASGTSGQKVPLNGGINLSILDGWWPEAYDGDNGWAISDDRPLADAGRQDEADAQSLYRLLEEEVVPLYYTKENGLPLGWIQRMVASLATVTGRFSAARMVAEYTSRYYMPTATRGEAEIKAHRAIGASPS
ncbi:MAG: alpha-glucan phosphorylase [Gemmatimonadetes bacterium]|nr:alpha-glucan phosphorylase [Gemmatimonadota bacterium]